MFIAASNVFLCLAGVLGCLPFALPLILLLLPSLLRLACVLWGLFDKQGITRECDNLCRSFYAVRFCW